MRISDWSSDVCSSDLRCLGIVASTGGPNAVATVLQGLGADYSLPVFLVQHITASFLTGFVSWLEDTVSMPVVFATEGERPQAGHVYVSPPERSEEHTSELQSLMRNSYAVFCLK